MRYFLEVAYKGSAYAGFQVQRNAVTIQSKLEEALFTFYRTPFKLTGSSRTDAGVHSLQNYFHVDVEVEIEPTHLYNINSILPADIVIKSAKVVQNRAHCRFDAIARQYKYYIYTSKNPFIKETAWFYPYPINIDLLQKVARVVTENSDYAAFSKKNVQVNNFICKIYESYWQQENDYVVYTVKANRFLRGMVRALVATMLKVGRGKYSVEDFYSIFLEGNNTLVDFSAPPQGLFLVSVDFPA